MGTRRGAPGGAEIWRQRRDEARARREAPRPPPGLDSPAAHLPRVTSTEARSLARLGLHTVRDLLLDLPYGWDAFGGPTAIAGLPVGARGAAGGPRARIPAQPDPGKRPKVHRAPGGD